MPLILAPEAQPGLLGGRLPRTVEALLTTNVQALLEAHPPLSAEEAELLQKLQGEVARRYAPPVLTGTQLYAQLETCRLLPTGCHGIDMGMLRGGMRGGQMVEVCGESGSGKTQLCLTAAVLAARAGQRVVCLDTSNAWRAVRLREVVDAQAAAGLMPEGPLAADPLKFVEVRRCYDVHAVLGALDELMAQHAQQAQHGNPGADPAPPPQQQQQQQQQQQGQPAQDVRQPPAADQQQQQQPAAPPAPGAPPRRRRLEDLPVALLVLDSLSAVIGPILGGGQHNQGHALLATAAISLKSLGAACGAVVMVTNHMVGGSDDRRHEKRPAMGESWRNQPSVRIQLSRPAPGGDGVGGTGGVCTATLRASPIMPSGVTVPYELGPCGLTDPMPAAAQHGLAAGHSRAQQGLTAGPAQPMEH